MNVFNRQIIIVISCFILLVCVSQTTQPPIMPLSQSITVTTNTDIPESNVVTGVPPNISYMFEVPHSVNQIEQAGFSVINRSYSIQSPFDKEILSFTGGKNALKTTFLAKISPKSLIVAILLGLIAKVIVVRVQLYRSSRITHLTDKLQNRINSIDSKRKISDRKTIVEINTWRTIATLLEKGTIKSQKGKEMNLNTELKYVYQGGIVGDTKFPTIKNHSAFKYRDLWKLISTTKKGVSGSVT